MNIGTKIHNLRTDAGLTLQELGDKVGVGASTVRKWETSYIKSLGHDKIHKLAAALGTTPDYLLGRPIAALKLIPYILITELSVKIPGRFIL